MGLLDTLVYGIRDIFDTDSVQLPRRSRVKFRNNTVVTDDPVRDLIVVDVIAEGTVTPPGGDDTQVQFNDGGIFNGAPNLTYDIGTDIPTAVNAVLTSPDISDPTVTGTPVYQGTHGSIKSVVGEVTTSSTSATTVASYAMVDESHCRFDAVVSYVRKTNATKAGSYQRTVDYRRTSAGAPTIVGTLDTGNDHETTPADSVTIDVSSNTVRVRVTAADSDDRYWFCELRIQETLS